MAATQYTANLKTAVRVRLGTMQQLREPIHQRRIDIVNRRSPMYTASFNRLIARPSHFLTLMILTASFGCGDEIAGSVQSSCETSQDCAQYEFCDEASQLCLNEALRGPIGDPGAMGNSGPRGEAGPQGQAGPEGANGLMGEPGANGQNFDPEQDVDSDGFADWLEVIAGTDPTDDADVPMDDDQDGVPDVLRGPAGSEGAQGIAGADGTNGTDGSNGTDGIGITGVQLTDGELVVTLSTGEVRNLGNVVGPAGAQGASGDRGDDGISISGVQLESGEFVVSLSDGTRQNLGSVEGPTGPAGAPGQNGIDGINGTNGVNGADGISVSEATIEDGVLVVSLSNGQRLTIGSVVGPQGIPGQDGTNGIDGVDGVNGVGVAGVVITEAGTLALTLTNNQVVDAGQVVGPVGPAGQDGLAADLVCADGEFVQYTANGWACESHVANTHAHHPADSAGIEIKPTAVNIGNTRLVDGVLDFGAEADDALTQAMVKTLINGGSADALHTHAAQAGGGGGGACYTAWGTQSCGVNYSFVYQGFAWAAAKVTRTSVTDINQLSSVICVSAETGSTGGSRGSMEFAKGTSLINNMPCAMCCPTAGN